MGMHSVCKVLASVTLFLLAVYHTNHDNARCHAAPSPLADPKREGYSRLIQDIKNHPIVRDKVPPGITQTYTTRNESDFNAEAVNVSIQLTPVDILTLDTTLQVLEMSAYIRLSWQDPILAWNMSEYGGVEMIELSSSDVWTPTISVLNGVENKELVIDTDIPVCLGHLGMFTSVFSVHLRTSCSLNLLFFPFDKVSCNLTFISLTLLGVHVLPEQHSETDILETFSPGGEWSLNSVDTKEIGGLEYRENLKYTMVTLHLTRKALYYLMEETIPMTLFVFMNCLVFLIPPESGEKVSFVVSIFISNTVFSSFVNGHLPRGLDKEVPLVMVYLIFMCVWSILTFLATAFVIRRFHMEQADMLETPPTSPAEEKGSGRIKARTYDKILLFLSLLIAVIVTTSFAVLIFCFS